MAQGFRTEIFKLDDAQDKQVFHMSGSYIQAIQMSSASAFLQISVNNPNNELFDFRRGFGWMNGVYDRIYVTNAPQPGEWVKIMFGGDPVVLPGAQFQAFPVANDGNVIVTGQSGPVVVDPGFAKLSGATTGMKVWTTVSTTFVSVAVVPAGRVWLVHHGQLHGGGFSGNAHCVVQRGGVFVINTSNNSNVGFDVFDHVELQAGDDIRIRTTDASGAASLALQIQDRSA